MGRKNNTQQIRAAQPGSEKPSYEELKARLAELEKQNARAIEFRVGEKGGVSVYGLGRFPVTLYYEQWVRLLNAEPQLREYLEHERREGHLKLKTAA
jgi:hypothetical protein